MNVSKYSILALSMFYLAAGVFHRLSLFKIGLRCASLLGMYIKIVSQTFCLHHQDFADQALRFCLFLGRKGYYGPCELRLDSSTALRFPSESLQSSLILNFQQVLSISNFCSGSCRDSFQPICFRISGTYTWSWSTCLVVILSI